MLNKQEFFVSRIPSDEHFCGMLLWPSCWPWVFFIIGNIVLIYLRGCKFLCCKHSFQIFMRGVSLWKKAWWQHWTSYIKLMYLKYSNNRCIQHNRNHVKIVLTHNIFEFTKHPFCFSCIKYRSLQHALCVVEK